MTKKSKEMEKMKTREMEILENLQDMVDMVEGLSLEIWKGEVGYHSIFIDKDGWKHTNTLTDYETIEELADGIYKLINEKRMFE